jgi:hypothetical protein
VKHFLVLASIFVAIVISSQFVTIFVIQPIGAAPEGRTVIITRLNTMNFIDSADAWCERKAGGVNLLCRAAVMARVINQSTIFFRLPYSSVLYEISTNGKIYDK